MIILINIALIALIVLVLLTICDHSKVLHDDVLGTAFITFVGTAFITFVGTAILDAFIVVILLSVT